MSAWMLKPERLNALAIEIVRAKVWGVDKLLSRSLDAYDVGAAATVVAGRLYAENVASLRYRYGERAREMIYDPGALAPISTFDVLGGKRMEPGALAKLALCYAYQSCEHDAWETCDVKAVIDRLCIDLTRFLPGYDAAEWG